MGQRPEGLLPQKELTSPREKQHNSEAPMDMTDHTPRPWERGTVLLRDLYLGVMKEWCGIWEL